MQRLHNLPPCSWSTRPRPLGLLTAGLLLTAPTHALGGSELTPGGSLRIECLAAERTTADFRCAQALHFDSDDRLDVIAQLGDDLVYLAAPDPLQYSMICQLDGVTAFNGIRLNGSWVHGAAAADNEGLRIVQRTGETAGALVVESVLVGGAEWAGARAVVPFDLDNDGDQDVVGLDVSGTQLLQLINGGGSAGETTADPATWTTAPPLDLGMELAGLDVATVGGGAAFVGVAPAPRADAVAAFDTNGALLLLASVGGAVDDFKILTNGAGDDSFALLLGSVVTVMDTSGRIEPGVDLAEEAPTAMSVADVDADGRADVLVNSTTGPEVTALLRVGGTADSLDAASVESFGLDAPGADWSMQRSAPIGADFDDDGDVDVLQFVDSERYVSLRRSTRVNETTGQTSLIDTSWNLTPNGSSADLWVKVPPLADGTSPDYLEVMLTSNPVDPLSGDPRHKFISTEVIDVSDAAVGQVAYLNLQWAGPLGSEASVSFRPLGVDPTGLYVDRTGVELAYVYVGAGVAASPGRGTDNPIDVPPFPGPLPPSKKLPPRMQRVRFRTDVKPL